MLCIVLKSYVLEEDALSFRVGHLSSNIIKQNINSHKSSFLKLFQITRCCLVHRTCCWDTKQRVFADCIGNHVMCYTLFQMSQRKNLRR
jgi:hypothetical protein